MRWSLFAPAIPRRLCQYALTGRTVPQTTRRGRQRGVSWCTRHRITLCARATTSRTLRQPGRASGDVPRMCWDLWTSSAPSNLWRTSRYVAAMCNVLHVGTMYSLQASLQLVTALFLLLVLCISLVGSARRIDTARPPPAYCKDTKVRTPWSLVAVYRSH